MNPIIQQMNRTALNQNPVVNMFRMVRSSRNPAQMLQNMAMQNPQIQQALNIVNTQYGGNMQNAFYDMAKKRGVDPQSVLGMFR